jgi:hypothetical protein
MVRLLFIGSLLGFVVASLLTHAHEGATENPFVRYALTRPESFDGNIAERVPAGSYLYVRVIDAAAREHWVATLAATASSTTAVRVTAYARASKFTSRRLSRQFESLSFGSVSSRSPTIKESP